MQTGGCPLTWTYLLIFSNNGAVLLYLGFRLIKLPPAHLLQLQKHTDAGNVRLQQGRDQGQKQGQGPLRDLVNAVTCKEDGLRYWQTWSSWQCFNLHTTSRQAHKSLTAPPTHSWRQETFGGHHSTHMGTDGSRSALRLKRSLHLKLISWMTWRPLTFYKTDKGDGRRAENIRIFFFYVACIQWAFFNHTDSNMLDRSI